MLKLKGMKRLICLIISLLTAISITGCSKSNITVYAPDGAPALSLYKAMDTVSGVDFKIVGSETIETVVTGRDMVADVCILPLDSASRLIGDGSNYQMLGAVTHGNFYFLSKDGEINEDNLSSLVGKTIGVLQLKKVPGLTFKAVLDSFEIPYVEISNVSLKQQDKVNLIAINKTEVCSSGADVYLVPSPMADIKEKATSYSVVGSLHELYSDSGFIQAVVVAKKSVITSNINKVKEIISCIKGVESLLLQESVEKICLTIENNLESGLTPSFNKNNLTSTSISRANIKFISAKNCKAEVLEFLQKIKAVEPSAVKDVSDEFFYQGEL